jgi:hypothetical protein
LLPALALGHFLANSSDLKTETNCCPEMEVELNGLQGATSRQTHLVLSRSCKLQGASQLLFLLIQTGLENRI